MKTESQLLLACEMSSILAKSKPHNLLDTAAQSLAGFTRVQIHKLLLIAKVLLGGWCVCCFSLYNISSILPESQFCLFTSLAEFEIVKTTFDKFHLIFLHFIYQGEIFFATSRALLYTTSLSTDFANTQFLDCSKNINVH